MTTALPETALSEDALLGGRVRLRQPRHGYRAATDPVLLAAACAAQPGDRVLDAGCGVGAAVLCLAARVRGLSLHGLELQPPLADLARANASENGVAVEVVTGDLGQPPLAIKSLSFDHVITNPPFFERHSQGSALVARDVARREGALGLRDWLRACFRRLRQGGWLTMIHRAERLPCLLAACEGRAGSIELRPLAARAGRPAGRVVMRARKDSRGPMRLCAPLILHEGAKHLADCDDFTTAARAILRDGAPLDF